jgi:hypothetical protein
MCYLYRELHLGNRTTQGEVRGYVLFVQRTTSRESYYTGRGEGICVICTENYISRIILHRER